MSRCICCDSKYECGCKDFGQSLFDLKNAEIEIKKLKADLKREQDENDVEKLQKETDYWKGMYRVISEREALQLKEIKELKSLIKEATPWIDDYNCNHISDFIGDEKAELFQRSVSKWLEKTEKIK